MGILDTVKKYFSREQQEVYCQHCGSELTGRGADITNFGKIYCSGYNGVKNACILKVMLERREANVLVVNFHGPAEVQKAIRKRRLIEFGPLEQTVEDGSRATP